MKNKKVKLIAVFLMGLGSSGLYAQEAVPASGGNASGGGGSVSYSVGQIVYNTATGTNGSEAQGVQQPYEISIVGIEQAGNVRLSCEAYPNPVTDLLMLRVEKNIYGNLSYQLYDEIGKLLESANIKGTEKNISMHDFFSATYFLKVSANNKEIKTFKIVKK